MLANQSLSILEQPLAPPWFGRCPTCRRWFVFRQVRQHSDSLSRTVQTWRCRAVVTKKHLPTSILLTRSSINA